MGKKSARVFNSSRPPPLSSGDRHEVRNEILLSLPSNESKAVLSKLTLIHLKLHDPMQIAGDEIDYAYFPNTAMASFLRTMEDGKNIEVGLVGKEGFVGLPLLAGFKTSPHQVIAQGSGTAFRMKSEELHNAIRDWPQLMKALLRHSQRFIMQTTQIAACNRLHEGDERLARWLLMTHDRVGTNELPLTQEFLSQMLGSRRASVSLSAIALHKAGLISYVHGKVTILDRAGLEEASCECYGILQQQFEKWESESH
jgi:CRP-like cAMP-binding protein